jgi:hypothetical protein
MRALGAAERIARAQARFDALTVGDHLTVVRNGREYPARVTYVGPRGARRAEFTYGNGARREVPIVWGDVL